MSSTNTKTILLVEDEESLILLYKTVFSKHFNVEIASNKKDAEKILVEKYKKIELILLDVIIPPQKKSSIDYSKRTGFELLKIIKADSKYNKLKILILTNLDSPGDRKTAKELEADDYIVKSNTLPQDLLAKVTKTLS
ncbi:MAG: response regulator [Patescibacteria group bacterium]